MAKLSIQDVEHIANLSKLELSRAEKEKFAEQLSSILQYVEELNSVDTRDVEITAQVTGLNNVAVLDETENGKMDYEKIKANAPEFRGDSFVVPGVFGE